MKSLMSLVQEVLTDVGTWCGVSTTNDFKTVVSRVEAEGLSFLTISLPSYASDLQKGLEHGKVDHQLFQGFRSGRGGLPLFLGGFLDLVFDRKSGLLLDVPNVDAIFAIRQISLLCSKINLPCTPKRERAALTRYIECESDVRKSDALLSPQQVEDFSRVSSLLWASVLSEVDRKIYYGNAVPKHGPGATADKLRGNAKYRQSEWTQRLEEYFPEGEYLFPNWRHYDANRTNIREPGAEMPVKVISVPKTLKTPRIIAVEPTAMQYVQQGIAEILTEAIRSDKDHRSGMDRMGRIVGFDDQETNQSLAHQGSLFGSLATLDLSDASDRVSNQHVRLLLRNHPHLLSGVDACRSRKADVPGYGVQRLAKFASMGSALTFPIEAMIFSIIVFIGIESKLNRRLTNESIQAFVGRVRIYGDDIIVPVEFAESVVDTLHTFGYVVNVSKSFWLGKFRESCGKEFYDGYDVSVVRIRQQLPTQRRDAQEVISTVSLRNQFYKRGLWKVTKWLDELLEGIIPFPHVLPESPVLGRHSFLGYDTERMCPKLHHPLVKGVVVSSTPPKSPLSGSDALLKYFLKRGDMPFADREHLERSGRPLAVRIKQRLASAT
ncbi:TPA_asm: RNA-directed RNA polymerase [ssRNA phage Esthiorhiza.3_1]|uniref:RNA-directed RNA polymerase n=2 Tax=Leviviricetes TaxID=2842243 RepID=A0A8S5KZA1_9VIRU|nr:RNA-directed RNA polymerase [ssRNA phage Esthiorhiza.3_1]QDH87287.1 MAG: RNA-dependent RNA polymerase [Leviviridae sp.]DAD50170.1 TPA_asm: RNA-directed RNA polymerase [ssRNA phage Esthiorhiza.3_1]